MKKVTEIKTTKPTKYRVGDTIRLRTDLVCEGDYTGERGFFNPKCVDSMEKLAGKEFTVKDIGFGGVRDEVLYYLPDGKTGGSAYIYTATMFEDSDKQPLYRVGDKVRIRTDLGEDNRYSPENDNECGWWSNPDMNELAGEVVTITKVKYYDGAIIYYIDKEVDDWAYSWVADMFEGLVTGIEERDLSTVEYEKIKRYDVGAQEYIDEFDGLAMNCLTCKEIIFSGNRTILIYNNRAYEECKVISKCHSEDTFDKIKGVKVATLKANLKESKRIMKRLIEDVE